MNEANKIDYTGVINAARRGDEDAFEFLYNDGVQKCRAICMKYFDPATEEGRRKTDDAVREVYVRMYDRIKTLSDPKDFPILSRSLTREVCLKKRKMESVQLETEAYIGVADAAPDTEEAPLVTAEECRREVRSDAMLKNETIGTLVLAVLHAMSPARRLAIVRWNEDDAAAMKDPDVLREAFICAEKTVMELEEATGLLARDYAKSRLAFFNWLLDLYNRFYTASTKDWNGAVEPAYALTLSGGDALDLEASEPAVSFQTIWSEIREQFYITNTLQLPSVLKALDDTDLASEGLGSYLEEEEPVGDVPTPPETPPAPARKKGLLGTMWGRLLVGILIIVVVLAAVIATAGQHTSHALTPAFMQFADFAFEHACGFNIS